MHVDFKGQIKKNTKENFIDLFNLIRFTTIGLKLFFSYTSKSNNFVEIKKRFFAPLQHGPMAAKLATDFNQTT